MHYTTQQFWKCYGALPEAVQRVADQIHELLKVEHNGIRAYLMGEIAWQSDE
jgi:hypothetical protein